MRESVSEAKQASIGESVRQVTTPVSLDLAVQSLSELLNLLTLETKALLL